MALITIEKRQIKKTLLASGISFAAGTVIGSIGATYQIPVMVGIGYVTAMIGALTGIATWKIFNEKMDLDLFEEEKDKAEGFSLEKIIEVKE